MKSNFYIICLFCLFYSVLLCTTFSIKQDGTGDFTTIQEGIMASANTDTVLVYQGTYFENINFGGKNITIGSLYLTTGDVQYIYNTIIDGNQTCSVVTFENGENENAHLCGFTIINGTGNPWVTNSVILAGGGIYVKNSSPTLSYCNVENNKARFGGGIYFGNSNSMLINININNNYAYRIGGGICLDNDSSISFDTNNLCSIYLNYAHYGSDIYKRWDCEDSLYVFVDTFTVMQPDYYFVSSTSTLGIQIDDIVMDIQNAKIEPVNADLFVSTDGSNDNSGLSQNDPLQTINFAYTLIASDSMHPNTIHVTDGIYSYSSNGQLFPIACRAFVSLVGESVDNTILDAEDMNTILYSANKNRDFSIENITFKNGFVFHPNPSYLLYFSNPYQIENNNITISNCRMQNNSGGSLVYFYCINSIIENTKFIDNLGGNQIDIRFYIDNQISVFQNLFINNCSQNNHPDVFSATPIFIFGDEFTSDHKAIFYNTQITENVDQNIDWPQSSCGIHLSNNIDVDMINCTVGNNSTTQNGSAFLGGFQGNTLNIYNSIFYGDFPNEFYIGNLNQSNPLTINIYNSLVEGGEDNIIIIPGEDVIINWDETTNLNENPLWLGTGDFPYYLQIGSSCIDSGTLDLPTGIELPQYDLAGNPRVYGTTIDMGAYEWQDSVSVIEEPTIHNSSLLTTNLSCYPNPFNPTTRIHFYLNDETNNIKLEIYNSKGQKVRTLIDKLFLEKGNHSFLWNGKDNSGKQVASGVYFYQLKTDKLLLKNKALLLK